MIQLAQIVFILSVLVILHEFGHYITAKWFKVRVEKFYLFMDAGFSLFKKKIGETEWGIGWLPIGGYVKLAGMIDESMDTEQMKQEPQPWEFRSKPAWQRLIIMLGGIIVNILLAWFIYTVMYTTVGKKYVSTEVIQKNGLAFGEVGQKAGFKNGDKIVSVDGKFQDNFSRMVMDILFSSEVKVDRNGEVVTLNLTDEQIGDILAKEGRNFIAPRMQGATVDSVWADTQAEKAGLKKGDSIIALNGNKFKFTDEFSSTLGHYKNDSVSITLIRNNKEEILKAKTDSIGKLGFMFRTYLKDDYVIEQKMSLFEAIPAAIKESWSLLVYNVKSFKLILRPATGAYKQVKSPVGIARQLPDTWNWEFIWNFTALFSIGLAFMNLLPIPGLDGGHALFTIAEMITGKTLSDKAAGYVQTAGMIILLTLMALTFGKDIVQLIIDKFF
ncbi:RIP metalloprotease RseP [Flavobacterium sp. NRK F10]|uniref:Zinc metalloprotease n=1 Tax=Flavobacterium sediminis TaxID=2201181 RepID=A0A2U8QSA3_9FLAO|nr:MULTISPECIES: RIP metalloprotease RseP [Flavobacterium]AWM12989.1 RIP metalloprotease RseP [Flavobacterium sediminis]MCO6174138.1 RIP metalloprotease RseP [Flavobacterium sp. NRK F10]